MKILMIAPEPFFEPRGTPFSEYHRIRALLELGHTVDLVTYPFGQDVAMPGLRAVPLPAAAVRPRRQDRAVARQDSARRGACADDDPAGAERAVRRRPLARGRQLHRRRPRRRCSAFRTSTTCTRACRSSSTTSPSRKSRLLKGAFSWIERLVIRRSRVVIVICPQLEETVRGIDRDVPTVLIENAPGSGDTPREGSGARGAVRARARRRHAGRALHRDVRGVPGARPAVCRRAASSPPRARTRASCWPAAVRIRSSRRRRRRGAEGVAASVVFAGQRPAEEIPAYLDAADVLVSPRSHGTNTPLKIYQYLRSGRPIVATRLLTHTQVLDDEVSILTDGDAGGLRRRDPRGARRSRRARATSARRRRRLAETKYSYEAYLNRTRQACGYLAGGQPRPDRRGRRVTTARAKPTDPDHYSYSVYADPAMAESFDALRFGGPIGRLLARIAGAGHHGVSLAASPAGASSTSAPAPAARRLRSRARARPSPASMRRRRCWPSRGAAPSTRARAVTFDRGDAHRLDVRRSRRSTRSCACAC